MDDSGSPKTASVGMSSAGQALAGNWPSSKRHAKICNTWRPTMKRCKEANEERLKQDSGAIRDEAEREESCQSVCFTLMQIGILGRTNIPTCSKTKCVPTEIVVVCLACAWSQVAPACAMRADCRHYVEEGLIVWRLVLNTQVRFLLR